MSPSQERSVGRQEHPKVLATYGGVYRERNLDGYVAQVGGRIAANTEVPADQFTVTLLDTPVANAFALPGGYVYVTRGILALANSEAELAGVLAHEMGHVTARHGAQRQTQGVIAQLGAVALGALSGSREVAQVAAVGAKGYIASHSRGQESEADALGVRYLTRSGYDPYAEADFLANLGAQSDLQARLVGKERDPNRVDFFSTHPATPQRVVDAIEQARRTGLPVKRLPRREVEYLRAIDGMIYGDGPEQGYVRDRRFAHPKLRFAFEVPQGFRIFNSSRAVVAKGPSGAVIQFDSAKPKRSRNIVEYLTREWAAKTRLNDVEQIDINGMNAATGWTELNGRSGRIYARVIAIDFEPGVVYRFLMAAPANQANRYLEEFQRATYTFRRLTTREANALRPQRIRVVEVRRGDTVRRLARSMPFSDFREERFRVLNGLKPGEEPRPGTLVKTIVEG